MSFATNTNTIDVNLLDVETLSHITAGIVFGKGKRSLKGAILREDRLINLQRYDAYGMHHEREEVEGQDKPVIGDSIREAYIAEVVGEVLYKLSEVEALNTTYESYGTIEVVDVRSQEITSTLSLRVKQSTSIIDVLGKLKPIYDKILKLRLAQSTSIEIREVEELRIVEVSPFSQLCRIISSCATNVARSYNRGGMTGRRSETWRIDATSYDVDVLSQESESESTIRYIAIIEKLNSIEFTSKVSQRAREMLISCIAQGEEGFLQVWHDHKQCISIREERIAKNLLSKVINEIESELIAV